MGLAKYQAVKRLAGLMPAFQFGRGLEGEVEALEKRRTLLVPETVSSV